MNNDMIHVVAVFTLLFMASFVKVILEDKKGNGNRLILKIVLLCCFFVGTVVILLACGIDILFAKIFTILGVVLLYGEATQDKDAVTQYISLLLTLAVYLFGVLSLYKILPPIDVTTIII